MARAAERPERAGGDCSTTSHHVHPPSGCYMHRCAFLAPHLIGTHQKCAQGNAAQEREAEVVLFLLEAATGASCRALTDRRKTV